jgi:hypothetical protein
MGTAVLDPDESRLFGVYEDAKNEDVPEDMCNVRVSTDFNC